MAEVDGSRNRRYPRSRARINAKRGGGRGSSHNFPREKSTDSLADVTGSALVLHSFFLPRQKKNRGLERVTKMRTAGGEAKGREKIVETPTTLRPTAQKTFPLVI